MHPAILSRRIRAIMRQDELIAASPLQPVPATMLAVLAGALLILPFRAETLYPLTWIALVPLLYAIRGQKLVHAAGLGWLAGTAAHVIGVYWLIGTMVRFGGIHPAISLVLFVLIAAALGTIYIPFVLVCRLMPAGRLDSTLRGALLIAAAFTAGEFIFPSVFPWRIGYSQIRIPALVQMADITGAYGITFITALGGAVLFQLLISFRQKTRPYPWPSVAVLITLLVIFLGYGVVRLNTVQQRMAAADSVRLALLQPNVPFDEKFDPALATQHNLELFQMSAQAAARDARLVIWPETGYRSPILGDTKRLEVPVSIPANTYLYIGANVFDKVAGGYDAHNSVLAVAADGSITGRYDKHHLFPFGEYLPLSDVFPILKQYAGPISDFKAGAGPPVQVFPDGITVGPLICYEDIFPGLSRRAVNNGARVLVNQTNDAWFGDTAAPHQHLQLARFRSIENRLPMIRATNSGVTAVVSPTGEITSKLDTFTRDMIIADIPLPVIRTFYTAYGDVFAVFCLISVAALLLVENYHTIKISPRSLN